MRHGLLLLLVLAARCAEPAHAGSRVCLAANLSDGEPYEPRTFLGYACVGHCEAHKTGFAWGERHGIADPTACTLDDPLVAQGCRAYALDAVTAELAGFEWARENEISDTCRCRGAGPAFEAGCRAFVTSVGD